MYLVIVVVTRASSMTETDSQIKYERQWSKSRPRPGTSLGGGTNPLIAPPPSSQRKNSNATESEDLISFTSMPTSTSNIIEFCNLQRFVIIFILFTAYKLSTILTTV